MDFRSVIARLERQGKVVHVKSEVDPVHELAGIAKKFEGQEKIVVFDRVKGQKYPVACGLWWNRDIIGSLFGVKAGEPESVRTDGAYPGAGGRRRVFQQLHRHCERSGYGRAEHVYPPADDYRKKPAGHADGCGASPAQLL